MVYPVAVGSDKSSPFDVGDSLYKDLRIDALRFFYYSRSGVAISMPFAKEERWARPAGHVGDRSVPCATDATFLRRERDLVLVVVGKLRDCGFDAKIVSILEFQSEPFAAVLFSKLSVRRASNASGAFCF